MHSFLSRLPETPGSRFHFAVPETAQAAFFLATQVDATKQPFFCLTPTFEQAESLVRDLSFFTRHPVLLYPSHEVTPYGLFSPAPHDMATRIAMLYKANQWRRPFFLVMDAASALRRTLPCRDLLGAAELVMTGEECDRDQLVRRLVGFGYTSVSLVTDPGEFSVRGDILDIFPPDSRTDDATCDLAPVRLEFFGDCIETIKQFDPGSQRSGPELDEVVLLPAGPVLYPVDDDRNEPLALFRQAAETHGWHGKLFLEMEEKIRAKIPFPGIEWLLPLFYRQPLESIDDYLPENCCQAMFHEAAIHREMHNFSERIAANLAASAAETIPVLPPESLFLSRETVGAATEKRTTILFHPFAANANVQHLPCRDHRELTQQIHHGRCREEIFSLFATAINSWVTDQGTVVIACRSQKRAAHLADILSHRLDHPPVVIEEGSRPDNHTYGPGVFLRGCSLSSGFSMESEHLHFVSETQLLANFRLGKKSNSRAKARPPLFVSDLAAGDTVVHSDHGLCLFQGMEQITTAGVTGDFIRLEFAGGDRLFLPSHRLHLLSKYKGAGEGQPVLDKLGGSRWAAARKKVKKAIWQVARDLLDLYARRNVHEGHRFSPPSELFAELEESFPFDETPDQKRAIDEILDDLSSPRPMDRLVCGDVGFGKTEVAVRAVFKVLEDGFQAAVLVPTTILAEQHARTFEKRLQGLPVKIACLTRFRQPNEQKNILAALKAGTVDLVIGTHRLLSKDVAFRRLGLLVVDEEHRFGVSHKEKIKKMRQDVDVLTLTATPIPRTMQLSLFGLRDMSVMITPPQSRLPVKTYVACYEDLIVREAIVRELARGGQVFFVHNRVQSIERTARRLLQLVPQARIAVAHGQMQPVELEKAMVQFVTQKTDVLVCTTIIESGLDIENANTMIINRADRLGLADIYQLRGRVGRGTVQAYAYLLVPSLDFMSDKAGRRLQAVLAAADLGGGYQLAMDDLQIRGGGNILGVSQSGHITAVGYDMYLELLRDTILQLKQMDADGVPGAGETTTVVDPEINLRHSIFLPESYINDPDVRFSVYRRLSLLSADREPEEALADMKDELRDRFGPLPEEAEALLLLLALKARLARLCITRLDQGEKSIVLSFHEKTPVAAEAVLALTGELQQKGRRVTFSPAGKLAVFYDELPKNAAVHATIAALLDLIDDYSANVNASASSTTAMA